MTEEISKNVGFYIDRTLRRIRLDLGRRFQEIGVDITPEQYIILFNLYERNGQSQTELGENSFKNAPTVSRIIDLLCDKGLTERQRFEGDRRRYKVFLTETGGEVVEKATPVVEALRAKGWQGLSEADYQTFLRIINQVFHNFDDIS